MIVQLLNVFGKEEMTIEDARRFHHYYFTLIIFYRSKTNLQNYILMDQWSLEN